MVEPIATPPGAGGREPLDVVSGEPRSTQTGRRAALAATITAMLSCAPAMGLLAGCWKENPRYCESDEACRDPSREGYSPSTPECHGTGNFCYEGCYSDADCRDTSESWYLPGMTVCNLVTRDCVPLLDAGPPDDGGADQGSDGPPGDLGLPNGSPCSAGGPGCASGHCANGYCCDQACDKTCMACNVKGEEGSCSFVPAGTDPDGDCPGTPGCGGDVCDGSGACTPFAPKETVCKAQCKAGEPDTLEVFTCDGAGACGGTASETLCKPYVCLDGSGSSPAACASGCSGHGECSDDSLCDRTEAHLTGTGTCVQPDQVVVVGPGESHKKVQDGVSEAASKGRPYVRISDGLYNETVVIDKGKVALVAAGAVTIKAPNKDKPVLQVKDGAAAAAQGLELIGAWGNDNADGITCQCASDKPCSLTVIESTIKGNGAEGIEGSYCALVLRRSRIEENSGGGLDLAKSNVVIESNLIAGNGKTIAGGSALGGVKLDPGTSSVSFFNNTIADNVAASSVSAGVICVGPPVTLTNSILWKNSGVPYVGCAFSHSDVEGGAPPGSGNISQDPLLDASYLPQTGSPCIDAGTTVASVLDLANKPRPATSGGKVDIGAFEVK